MSLQVSRASSQDSPQSILKPKVLLAVDDVSVRQQKTPIKTALHQAVADGRIHQARLLSASTRDIDIKDLNGWTPLMLTCSAKKDQVGKRMMTIFLEKGAKVNSSDKMGRTPLMIACLSGNEKIVRKLMADDNLEISAQDSDGNTALIHAAMKRNTDILRLLLRKTLASKVSVDTRNHMGYTALLLSCKLGNFDNGLKLLREGNACPYIRDMEHKYCAKEWINWYKYKQSQQSKETNRFPHLRDRHSLSNVDPRLPEEESMNQLLKNTYQPFSVRPVSLSRSTSFLEGDCLAKDSAWDEEKRKDESQQTDSMDELNEALSRLEEAHHLERERLSALRAGSMTNGRRREISTARLRRVAREYGRRQHRSEITLPQILSLYALNHHEKSVVQDYEAKNHDLENSQDSY
ncbi:inversin-like [Watersipora subatra]|uniref:inversin-like n=1 Tax=Watersipora subatra TaxID=2589382 RepID=UPI00355BBD90